MPRGQRSGAIFFHLARDYLPNLTSRIVSLPFGGYQIVLLGDGGMFTDHLSDPGRAIGQGVRLCPYTNF